MDDNCDSGKEGGEGSSGFWNITRQFDAKKNWENILKDMNAVFGSKTHTILIQTVITGAVIYYHIAFYFSLHLP